MRVGDCSIVVAHWQNTGKSSQSAILGSIPGDCRPLHFLLLLSPHNTSTLHCLSTLQFNLVHSTQHSHVSELWDDQ